MRRISWIYIVPFFKDCVKFYKLHGVLLEIMVSERNQNVDTVEPV